MAITNRPVKVSDANGSLKRLTDAEELYLAYQLGNHLAGMDSSDVGALTTISSGNTNIGSYTDIKYNQAVGTRGDTGSTITETTTTTALFQKTGTGASSGTNWRTPIGVDASGKIKEMVDSDFTHLTDKLLRRVMLDEYPGTYRLGSSSPGGTYDTHLASAFSDTLSGGTTVNYNIYQKQTMSAPSVVRPVHVKKAGGDQGTFQGVQTYTDRELSFSLGENAKTRIMSSANYVGAYQLRSSAQGVPSASGTWVARGTATNTQRTLSSGEAYTGDYETAYTSPEVETFTGDYTGNFTSAFSGNFDNGDFTDTYAGNYTGDFTVADFVGEAGFLQTTFVGEGGGNFLGADDYLNTAFVSPAGNFLQNYSDYVGTIGYVDAGGNFVGPPSFLNSFAGIYYGTSYDAADTYTGASTTYTGQEGTTSTYTGNYDGIAYTGRGGDTYEGYYYVNYLAGPATAYVANYVGGNAINYTSDFIGPGVAYTGGADASTFAGITIVNSTGAVDYLNGGAETYTGTSVNSTAASTGNYDGATYTTTFISSEIEDFTANAEENYGSAFAGNFTTAYQTDFTSQVIQSGTQTIETYTLYCRIA